MESASSRDEGALNSSELFGDKPGLRMDTGGVSISGVLAGWLGTVELLE